MVAVKINNAAGIDTQLLPNLPNLAIIQFLYADDGYRV